MIPFAAEFAAAWDDLVDRSAEPCPWLRPGWVDAWWRAFGRGRLDVVTRRRGARLAALAPFAARSRALVATANYHTPEFEFVGEDEDAVRDLATAVLAREPRRLEARFVSPGNATAQALRDGARRCGYRLLERPLERSPFVETSRGWDAYLTGLGGKRRRELHRRRRKLDERGRVEVEVDDGRHSIDGLLAEGLRVEGSGWKEARGTAIASDAATVAFYGAVAHWAAGRGTLRLAYLRLDGQAIAFDFAIEEAGRHYLLKTGYDPAYRSMAPGLLLRREMIERAFRLGLQSYEFLGTDDPWKLDWTTSVRERVELQAFAPTAPGRADWAAHRLVRPLVARALTRVGR